MALPSSSSSSATPRLCPICGTRVGEAATKCIVCGANLNKEDNKPRGTIPLPLVGKGNTAATPAVTPSLTQPLPTNTLPNPANTTGSLPVLPSQMPASELAAPKGQISIPLPLFIGILLLVVVGGVALTLFFVSQNGLAGMLQPATATSTATPTKFPTLTPLPTNTATFTPTLTPLPPLSHTVNEGETCGFIAYKYGVSIKAITELNGLPSDCSSLIANQKLLIPQPTATPAPTGSSTVPPSMLTQEARPTHKVSAGESLSSLAVYYNVDFKTFAEINGKLGPDYAITVGEKLVVPIDVPAPTAGPSPTATPLPPKPAPQLLNPADGFAVSAIEQVVNLEWEGIGTLAEGEAYQVTVEDVTAERSKKLQAVTLTNRLIVPVDLKPWAAEPHIYRWSVVVVRQAGLDDKGNPIYVLAGETSTVRSFSWTGIGILPSNTAAP